MTVTRVDVRDDEGVVVARLVGDVDLADTAAIAARVLAAVSNDSLGLVVDLSDVRYLDSAGIQMLFELTRRLESGRQGVAVVVDGASPVRGLLEMTSMEQAAVICGSETDAITAVRDGTRRRY